MSKLPSAIFREYDIRGVVGPDLNADAAGRIARAFAVYLFEAGVQGKITLGRDCRVSSDELFAAFRDGLTSSGFDVVDIGVCPTPILYFSLFHLDPAAGVQITGSHNPADYNGFKLSVGKSSLWGEKIQTLREIVESGRVLEPERPGVVESYDIVPEYRRYVRGNTPLQRDGMRIVIDGGNGTGGHVAAPLFESLGFDVVRLYCDMDGEFPNHHPDPTVADNLQDLIKEVVEGGAALGLAYDGDADRIGAVDDKGRILWGDQLLTIFARDILERNPGATIIGEVKCSKLLYEDVEARGGRAIMWKTGHSILKQKLKDEEALLAGEMSGHIFIKENYFGYDDAIYSSVRLVDILQRSGKRSSELLADLPQTFTTPEIRVDCADDKKFAVADAAREHFARDHEVIDIDGVRVSFPDGWGLIRASNTQPVLVLRFEATSEEKLREMRTHVEGELNRIRGELGA